MNKLKKRKPADTIIPLLPDEEVIVIHGSRQAREERSIHHVFLPWKSTADATHYH